MEPKFKSKHERADEIMGALSTSGMFQTRDFLMNIVGDHTVTVYDRRTDELVAFSSTKADFSDSVAEFVYDYMV